MDTIAARYATLLRQNPRPCSLTRGLYLSWLQSPGVAVEPGGYLHGNSVCLGLSVPSVGHRLQYWPSGIFTHSLHSLHHIGIASVEENFVASKSGQYAYRNDRNAHKHPSGDFGPVETVKKSTVFKISPPKRNRCERNFDRA